MSRTDSMRVQLLVFTVASLSLTGCQAYRYRVVQPNTGPPPVTVQPVTIHYEPLEYRLSQDRNRLAMMITNPTGDRIALLGNRSFAVDPQGESHPLRDRVLAPHSYTRMLLPPVPFTYAYPDYYAYGPYGPGWGYWGGWWDPYWGPWYGPGYWGSPPMTYEQILTQYDWKWKSGQARLRLTYERAGKTFEHDFELVREPDKK